MKAQKLILFTSGYPFGDSEYTFLHEEVKILSPLFEKIYIIPLLFKLGETKREIPSNVEVLDTVNVLNSRGKRSLGTYLLAIKLVMWELAASKNYRMLFNLKYHISEVLVSISLAENINTLFRDNIVNEKDYLFYTYWYDNWTSALSVLKYRYNKKINFISRAHGYDLYEERRPQAYIFPRHIQNKSVDKVYAISRNGYEYLKNKYPKFENKFSFSRIGTHGPSELIEIAKREKEVILIVSCSSISPVKRLHKVVEILMNATVEIKWIHFGSGELEIQIKELLKKLPKNVKAELKDSVENEKILEFYSSNHLNWFINVSEAEGIPVSIMEAISYGVPIMATDVGGTSEIVNDVTGILIEKEFDPLRVMQLIESTTYTNEQRKLIHDFWKKNYNADANFKQFAISLQELNT